MCGLLHEKASVFVWRRASKMSKHGTNSCRPQVSVISLVYTRLTTTSKHGGSSHHATRVACSSQNTTTSSWLVSSLVYWENQLSISTVPPAMSTGILCLTICYNGKLFAGPNKRVQPP